MDKGARFLLRLNLSSCPKIPATTPAGRVPVSGGAKALLRGNTRHEGGEFIVRNRDKVFGRGIGP